MVGIVVGILGLAALLAVGVLGFQWCGFVYRTQHVDPIDAEVSLHNDLLVYPLKSRCFVEVPGSLLMASNVDTAEGKPEIERLWPAHPAYPWGVRREGYFNVAGVSGVYYPTLLETMFLLRPAIIYLQADGHPLGFDLACLKKMPDQIVLHRTDNAQTSAAMDRFHNAIKISATMDRFHNAIKMSGDNGPDHIQ